MEEQQLNQIVGQAWMNVESKLKEHHPKPQASPCKKKAHLKS